MGDHAIWAETPWFPLRRNRPLLHRSHRRWRRNRASGRVSWPTSFMLSAKLTAPGAKDKRARNSRTKCRPGGRRLRHVPGGIFSSGATQTNGGEIFERRCCLRGIVPVVSPPESTSRAGRSNDGEEIERKVTSVAAPVRFPQADFAEQSEQNQRPHIT